MLDKVRNTSYELSLGKWSIADYQNAPTHLELKRQNYKIILVIYLLDQNEIKKSKELL